MKNLLTIGILCTLPFAAAAAGWDNTVDQFPALPGEADDTARIQRAIDATPWMVAATAQTNSNRSSPDGVMLDILVHPFMFGIVPHYLKCVYYITSPRNKRPRQRIRQSPSPLE